MTPTLHVTNASSRRLHHGAVFSIMAAPRKFERFAGNVAALTPRFDDLIQVKTRLIPMHEYRRRCDGLFRERWLDGALTPGVLLFSDAALDAPDAPVPTLATLVCACAKAAADRGECHRVWAAEFLRQAGWRVVLDGRELA